MADKPKTAADIGNLWSSVKPKGGWQQPSFPGVSRKKKRVSKEARKKGIPLEVVARERPRRFLHSG